MFGVNAIARRAVCGFKSSISPRIASMRLIHASHPVMKKKQAVDIENLFDDMEITDDLVSEPSKQSGTAAAKPTSGSSGRALKNGLSVEDRQNRFDQLVEFVKPRIGRKPQTNLPTVRNSAWLILLQMATSAAQLKQVVDLMPAWKERGREFNSTFSESFIRRCQELRCPLLALEVYGNYAKFNVPLTLPAARQLLHSLQGQYPIENLMTASALYGLYNLPPAAQDYVSCAIIVNACLRHNSTDSNNIAEALLPHLRQLQASTTIDPSDTYHRENVWVQKAVESVDKILKQRKDAPAAPIDVSSPSGAAEASL